jgi:tetratricopeptide (TPR) repeat protein
MQAQARAQVVEQIVDDLCARELPAPVRRLLRVPPTGEGAWLVHSLTTAIERQRRQVLRLDLPGYDIDASDHVLGQLCQALKPDDLPGHIWDHRLTVHERVADITSRLASRSEAAPAVALYIPWSWFRRPQDPRRTLPDNPSSVLRALLHPKLDAIVVSVSTPPWLQQQMQSVAVDIGPPEAGESFIFDASRWGELEKEAGQLGNIVGPGAFAQPPMVLRLGVACVALGHPEKILQQVFQRPDPYSDLVLMLQQSLRSHQGWKPGLGRLALPRFPVPRELLFEIVGEMSDGQRAMTACLLQEDSGGVRAYEVLRDILGPSRRAEPDANARLMQHHHAFDNAPTPREAAARGTLLSWLEVEHHRGHAGPDAPEGRTPLSRLIRYEQAWSLSVEFKEYRAAAAVYKALLADDPEDAYSRHYLAWNLDQSGAEGQAAWQEYQEAIRLEPDNPWYNSRFITFLRDNGFRREAHEAWERAVLHVLPGKWAARMRLPEEFHSWIVRSSLDVGDLELARKVLATLTPQDMKTCSRLQKLQEELQQYEEIEALGEPVYPSSVKIVERWKKPLLLPEVIVVPRSRRGAPRERRLRDWYPGRVEAIDGNVVTLVLAEPGTKRLFTVEVEQEKLVQAASYEGPKVGRFLEYGEYEGQVAHVRYHPLRAQRRADRERSEHGLRYLRDEAPSADA